MSANIEEIFIKSGAKLEGHFLLTSGLHSPVYWEKFAVLQYPSYTQELCRMIADHYRDQNIELVAGPTTGGVILAFEVARQLGVRGIFAEKKEGSSERVFRRGFNIRPGERILLVDDILSTGGSIQQTVNAIKSLNGNLVGIGVLVDRSPDGIDFEVPLYSCLRSPTVVYKPEECPLCKDGMPLTKRGSS
jgi:orotate phosphoribosyltransferase